MKSLFCDHFSDHYGFTYLLRWSSFSFQVSPSRLSFLLEEAAHAGLSQNKDILFQPQQSWRGLSGLVKKKERRNNIHPGL